MVILQRKYNKIMLSLYHEKYRSRFINDLLGYCFKYVYEYQLRYHLDRIYTVYFKSVSFKVKKNNKPHI